MWLWKACTKARVETRATRRRRARILAEVRRVNHVRLGHKRLQMEDSTRWRAKAKGGSLGIHVACCRIKLQSSLKITTATSSIASPGLEIKPSSFARSPNGVSPTRPYARSPQQVLFRHTYAGHRLQEIQREGCCDNDAHS